MSEFDISIGAGWMDSSGKISTLEEVQGVSTDDCEIACKNKKGCVGFTFVSTVKRCDLKNIQQATTLSTTQHNTIISGKIHSQGNGYGGYNNGGYSYGGYGLDYWSQEINTS